MHDQSTENPITNVAQVSKPRMQYEAPRLICYGDVRAITAAVGRNGNKDGGAGNAQKSRP